jgi:hypothetical protein
MSLYLQLLSPNSKCQQDFDGNNKVISIDFRMLFKTSIYYGPQYSEMVLLILNFCNNYGIDEWLKH